ncbi:hypothetical protein SAMN05518801_10233 [Novosphingobium sp. CF614]|uniref:DUF6356 family protein n=1 Tax=Novosphingobium sp. CF614 TaxID=1884364 RepID=UPI0008E2DA8D|nr:DUF6356 family protein [Novosphingobium sp. CF614]SFF82698.1 hypothetical protein SAMN05518801_10233 [Novosphingobium sp. CF614]
MRLFTEHPESVDETYFEHMGVALTFGRAMFGAALACIVHAFLPFLFERTGSQCVTRLHDRMVTHRRRNAAVPSAAPSPASTVE